MKDILSKEELINQVKRIQFQYHAFNIFIVMALIYLIYNILSQTFADTATFGSVSFSFVIVVIVSLYIQRLNNRTLVNLKARKDFINNYEQNKIILEKLHEQPNGRKQQDSKN